MPIVNQFKGGKLEWNNKKPLSWISGSGQRNNQQRTTLQHIYHLTTDKHSHAKKTNKKTLYSQMLQILPSHLCIKKKKKKPPPFLWEVCYAAVLPRAISRDPDQKWSCQDMNQGPSGKPVPCYRSLVWCATMPTPISLVIAWKNKWRWPRCLGLCPHIADLNGGPGYCLWFGPAPAFVATWRVYHCSTEQFLSLSLCLLPSFYNH